MILTKRTLIESVKGNTVDDYLQHGGLPQADAQQMDAEFYHSQTADIWEDVQNIINHYLKGDDKQRNKWAFESDLNADQMRFLEHHPDSITIELVKQRYTDKQVYDMIKAYKLNSPDEFLNLASYLLAESIPKL
jgi:hypothetical protein